MRLAACGGKNHEFVDQGRLVGSPPSTSMTGRGHSRTSQGPCDLASYLEAAVLTFGNIYCSFLVAYNMKFRSEVHVGVPTYHVVQGLLLGFPVWFRIRATDEYSSPFHPHSPITGRRKTENRRRRVMTRFRSLVLAGLMTGMIRSTRGQIFQATIFSKWTCSSYDL